MQSMMKKRMYLQEPAAEKKISNNAVKLKKSEIIAILVEIPVVLGIPKFLLAPIPGYYKLNQTLIKVHLTLNCAIIFSLYHSLS